MAASQPSPTTRQTLLLYWAGLRILMHRLMRRLFGSSAPPPIEWRELRCLLVGLDGAGKSSLVRRAGDASADIDVELPRTSGFSVRTVTVAPDFKCELWEIGGAAEVRAFWPRYATRQTDAVAWVVDGANPSRLGESARALAELLRAAPHLRTLPLLVLVTKADQPQVLGAAAVSDGLGLDALGAQGLSYGPRKVQPVSAADGRHLEDSLRWLCQASIGLEEQL